MGDIALVYSEHQCFAPNSSKHLISEETMTEDVNPDCLLSKGDSMTIYGSKDNEVAQRLLEKGFLEHGCSHYRRRCRIRAPCCNEIFYCRHCHNEAKNNINVDPRQRHDMPRHQISQVICSLCGTEQQVQQVCTNCGVCMAKYFCGTCKLFDDDTSKQQYHCDGCGICRIGGSHNFFHCFKCGCCYSVLFKDSHPCVEGAMHHDCPICFEFLFESRNDVAVIRCGHTIHKNCLEAMRKHLQYACPICCKSIFDMSKVWEKLDLEIAETPMPEHYQNKMVSLHTQYQSHSDDIFAHVQSRILKYFGFDAFSHVTGKDSVQRLWENLRRSVPFRGS